jgi:hypothetical protein
LRSRVLEIDSSWASSVLIEIPTGHCPCRGCANEYADAFCRACVALDAALLEAVVLEVHPVAEDVVDGEVLGAVIEAGAAVRRAVGAGDRLVVALEQRVVLGREGAARREDVLVDVLGLEEGNHEARDVRVGEHPFEGRLAVGLRVFAEACESVVAGALQGLHRDDAHVPLAARAVDQVAEARPDAVVIGEHHHVEAVRFDRARRHLRQVRRVRREAEEARLASA